jgi:hypothetical protein
MGACSFSNQILIKGNANDAYRRVNEEMNAENGHQQGYSGDIQTTDGFSMARNAPRYGTKAFDKWEDKQDEEMCKRDCLCVEITGASLKRLKERRGLKGRKE